MNTKQAEYQTDIARLAEQMAQRDAKLAERQIADTRWIIGVIIAMSLLVIAAIRL